MSTTLNSAVMAGSMAGTSAAADASAQFAGDARALNAIKRQGKDAPQAALRQAATQFEALFMNMLMKNMRDSLPQEDMMSSNATKSFTGMLDSQLSQKLAAGKGMGLADMMVRQLSKTQSGKQGAEAAGAAGAAGASGAASAVPSTTVSSNAAGALARKLSAATDQVRSSGDAADGAPQTFVKRMLPHAEQSAREAGIPAHFMLGQAALETGWGKSEIKRPDGSSSHNLFGIKAGRDWTGPTVSATTTEYVNGVARKSVEKFRAYESYADSFRDYARLVTGSRRYAAAAAEKTDAGQFARNIQSGGYATDPRYAEKLTGVINRALSLQKVA
jgi:flagellar protein FlgJ